MKITNLIIFFCFVFFASAQKKVVKIPERISVINDSLNKYRFTDTLKYISILNDLKHEAFVREDDHYLAYHNFFLGFHRIDIGKYKSADTLFENTLALLATQNFIDHNLYFKIYYQQAFVKYRIGESKQSNKYYWACYDHAQKSNDSSSIASASFGITNILSDKGNYREAKKFAAKTLEIDLALNDSTAIAYDYSVIALMYFKLKLYDEAEGNYRKANDFININESLHEYYNINLSLADVLIAQGNYKEALKISDYIIDKIGTDKFDHLLIRARLHRAHSMFYLGNTELAILELENIIESSKVNNFYREEIRALLLFGRIENNVYKSYEYLIRAKSVIEENKADTYYPQLFRTMMVHSDKYDIANIDAGYKDDYISFLEKIERQNQQSMVEGMDANFELHSMTELNAILELENAQNEFVLVKERSKKYILICLLLFMLFLFSGFYFYKKQKLKIKILEYENLISKLTEKVNAVVSQPSENTIPSREVINEKLLSPLTHKEYEILKDILAQMTNLQIAEKHYISINTVKFHLKNIFIKLDEPNKKSIIAKFNIL